MKKLLVAVMMLWSGVAWGYDLPKEMNKTFELTRTSFFELGFYNGALCAVKATNKYKELVDKGQISGANDWLEQQLNLCLKKAKKKHDIK